MGIFTDLMGATHRKYKTSINGGYRISAKSKNAKHQGLAFLDLLLPNGKMSITIDSVRIM
jgi:hypothetical protein